jgi:hypothetical protein
MEKITQRLPLKIMRVIKSRIIRWYVPVVCMG